jgi:hypothetical protein
LDPFDVDVPDEPIFPVALVRTSLTTSGNIDQVSGSAFFTASRGALITARHVVIPGGNTRATSIEVTLLHAGGSRFVMPACTASFFVDTDLDLAVIRLAEDGPAIIGGEELVLGDPVDSERFDARVLGYVNGAATVRDVVARAGARFIAYEEQTTEGGMSGGPLVIGAEAVGVHVGSPSSGGSFGAWRMPIELVERLIAEAGDKCFGGRSR